MDVSTVVKDLTLVLLRDSVLPKPADFARVTTTMYKHSRHHVAWWYRIKRVLAPNNLVSLCSLADPTER